MARICWSALTAALVCFAVAACHDKKNDGKPDDGDNDDGPAGFVERPPLTPYACDLETTLVPTPIVNLYGFVPGTTQAVLIGPTDATEAFNVHTYDLATGVVTVLANGGPPNRGALPMSLYDTTADAGLPNTVVARLWLDNIRRPQLYALKTDGTDGQLLGDGSVFLEEGFFTADKLGVVALASIRETGARKIVHVDVTSGAQRTLANLPSTQTFTQSTNEGAHPYVLHSGARVVYGTQDVSAVTGQRIMSARLDGTGEPIRLTPESPVDHTIEIGQQNCRFGVSAVADRVFYSVDLDADGIYALYAVNPDGTNPVQLSQTNIGTDPGVKGGGCLATPDGRLVYMYGNTGGVNELDVVGFDGTGRLRLDAAGVDPSFAASLPPRLSPAGDAVVFLAADGSLVLAHLDGSRVTLSPDVSDAAITFTNDRVVFLRNTSGKPRLWSVRHDGSQLVELTPAGTAADDVISTLAGRYWVVSDDGATVIVTRTAGVFPAPIVSDVFAVPTAGGAAVKLTPASWPANARINQLLIDAAGRVLATGIVGQGSATLLFRGSLTEPLVAVPRCAFDNRDVALGPRSADNGTVIGNESGTITTDAHALVAMRHDGTTYRRNRVEAPGPENVFVDTINGAVSADGSHYAATGTTFTQTTVFTGAAADGPMTRVAIPEGRTAASRGRLNADGTRLAFIASQSSLYVSALDGSNPHLITPAGAEVPSINGSAFRFTPDGRILFTAKLSGCSTPDLFIANLDGTGLAQLNPVVPGCGRVSPVNTEPYLFEQPLDGGAATLYAAAGTAPGTLSLFRQALDGSAPLKLTPASGPGSAVVLSALAAIYLSPDGSTLLYAASAATSGNELWAVPIGGGTARFLGDKLQQNNSVRFSPDGRTVAYDTNEVAGIGVVAAPVDASHAPVQVVPAASNSLFAVHTLALTDGEVYYIDNTGLHAVSHDGSGARAVYAFSPIAGIANPAASPAGDEILFYDDTEHPNISELYAFAIADGTVTRVSPTLFHGGAATGYVFGPNGSLLVVADSEIYGKQDFVQVR